MQLPPATAAPRLPSSGTASAPHSGSAAGFDSVMGGVLASGATASGGKPSGAKDQPASDDGGPGKPAADGSGTVARSLESHLVEPRPVEPRPDKQGEAKDAQCTADPANAAAAAGACAPSGLAISGLASGSAAAQGLASGLGQGLAPGKEGVSPAAGPLESVAGTVATGNVAAVAGGSASGGLSSAMRPATLPVNATVPSGPDGVAIIAGNLQSLGSTLPSGNTAPWKTPAASVPASPAPAALPAGNRGPSTVEPRAILPGPVQPIAASAAGPAPASPAPAGPALASPEAAASTTAALAGAAGTAVVLPSGKPGTQQDPKLLGGQGTPATAGIPAGIPAVLQPAAPLQQVPSAATPGVATTAPQADPAKLLPQVSGPLFSLAAGEPGRHVMTLRLSPEDLGPLTVRAHIDGAGVRIELFAPGEAGREAVRSILPELRRGLGESGFGASLDLSEHNAPADSGAGSDTRDRRPAESPAFPRGSDGEPVRLPRTAVVLPRSSTSSLDILV
ncbi:flagellar hook-length control protein FliK [Arthrobacter sp. MI7-26]|uniref:flagellar hook-length control protein FliK n=1 Tax=Arthrobacter sp. MI7-26 TaxID=2993653 RepID=UPI002248F0D1|nr:flagellar hook-length control protein FliK [Arthrobacter sp. MI7-26]MCX2749059.1 flagellar hook-length control protein FliK [Arthrobacter sp. MI7-26]